VTRLQPETLAEYGTWGPASTSIPIHPSMRRPFKLANGEMITVTGAHLNPRRVTLAVGHPDGQHLRRFVARLIEPGQPGAFDIEIEEHTLGFVNPASDMDALFFDASEEPEIAEFAYKAIRRMWPQGPRLAQKPRTDA
jgi:hypothetical protein